MSAQETTIGQVLSRLYEAAMAEYGDPELASVVVATVLDELLTTSETEALAEAA